MPFSVQFYYKYKCATQQWLRRVTAACLQKKENRIVITLCFRFYIRSGTCIPNKPMADAIIIAVS